MEIFEKCRPAYYYVIIAAIFALIYMIMGIYHNWSALGVAPVLSLLCSQVSLIFTCTVFTLGLCSLNETAAGAFVVLLVLCALVGLAGTMFMSTVLYNVKSSAAKLLTSAPEASSVAPYPSQTQNPPAQSKPPAPATPPAQAAPAPAMPPMLPK